MKFSSFLGMIFLFHICFSINLGAQSNAAAGMTTKFKVYGNCGMCEKRIEKAVKKMKGVYSADWTEETQMLTVQFDETKLKPSQIKAKVAAVGHDTDEFRAKDAVYAKLHECCQYERPARQ